MVVQKDEDKKKNVPNFTPIDVKPNIVPVDPEVYKKEIATGKRGVGFGAGAKRALAAQPSVSQVAGRAKQVLVDPLIEPFKEAGRGFGAIKGSVVGGVQDARYRQKQALGQTTPEEGVAYRERQDAKLPAASIESPEIQSAGTGQLSENIPKTLQASHAPIDTDRIEGEEGVFAKTPAEDFGPGKDYTVGFDQDDGGRGQITVHGGGRLGLGGEEGDAESRFRSAVPGDNSGTRAQQQQQFLARQAGVGTGRKFGAVRREAGGSGRDPLAMAREIMGPMVQTKGSSRAAKQLRSSRASKYQRNLASLAGNLAETGMKQSGESARLGTTLDSARERESMSNATAMAINKAKTETARANALTAQETAREEFAADKKSSRGKITEKQKLDFRKSAGEGYSKYLTDYFGDEGKELSKEDWISQTYDDETLSGYGYQQAAEQKPKNSLESHIDSLLQ